jgi:FKBP-type peptidyl-prolyl cis-trans isomerase
MKKFVILPILLALVFVVVILVNPESTSGGKKEGEEITTPSGLKITDLKIGTGKEAKKSDTVVADYVGTLEDGKQFDSSARHGGPQTFSLNEVVPGWQEGIPGMRVGGKRKLVVPAALGYGRRGFPPDVPPNAVLIFEIELKDVMQQK